MKNKELERNLYLVIIILFFITSIIYFIIGKNSLGYINLFVSFFWLAIFYVKIKKQQKSNK